MVTVAHALLVILAGIGAGAVNAVVGSGTLITFPTLLLIGVPPITANVSNSLGLIPGSLVGAVGYRREVRAVAALVRRFAPLSVAGSVAGAVLLLRLDPDLFRAVVPVLVVVGIVLVVVGPFLQRRAAARPVGAGSTSRPGLAVSASVFLTAVYGGYFGAAQGIILVGALGALLSTPVQQLNGLKNVLVALVNAVAAVVFLVVAPGRIDWVVVALVAVGSAIGGALGAAVGRHLRPSVLRAAIVVVGLVAVAKLLAG